MPGVEALWCVCVEMAPGRACHAVDVVRTSSSCTLCVRPVLRQNGPARLMGGLGQRDSAPLEGPRLRRAPAPRARVAACEAARVRRPLGDRRGNSPIDDRAEYDEGRLARSAALDRPAKVGGGVRDLSRTDKLFMKTAAVPSLDEDQPASATLEDASGTGFVDRCVTSAVASSRPYARHIDSHYPSSHSTTRAPGGG